MIEDGEGTNPLITSPISYIIDPAGDPPHTHSVELDDKGQGSLGDPDVGEPHTHLIVDWDIQSSGEYPHIHALVKKEIISPELPVGEVANKEWDDSVSDTKEKVKVSTQSDSPSVRRVFNQKGKYLGTFDTKKPIDKEKYKTMLKGAK